MEGKQEGQGFIWEEDTLPPEMVERVLLGGAHLAGGKRVVIVVCRSVCRWWRDILRPHPLACYFIDKAALLGSVSLLEWARENGSSWDETTTRSAAEGGHIEAVKWLMENGCPLSESACSFAAKEGHIKMLKWLRKKDCRWGSETCAYAAGAGQLETLQWLRRRGCPWGSSTCYTAAEEGRLEVLKWARGAGCHWDERVCTYAAKYGHVDVLHWAIEHGCPWNYKVVISKGEQRGLNLEYLREYKHTASSDTPHDRSGVVINVIGGTWKRQGEALPL